jgi:hypothetical protein
MARRRTPPTTGALAFCSMTPVARGFQNIPAGEGGSLPKTGGGHRDPLHPEL